MKKILTLVTLIIFLNYIPHVFAGQNNLDRTTLTVPTCGNPLICNGPAYQYTLTSTTGNYQTAGQCGTVVLFSFLHCGQYFIVSMSANE